jgi:integrase
MLSLAFNAGKLSRVPKLEMLAENNVRESFLERGNFMTLLSNLPQPIRDLVEFEYLSGWRQGSAKKLGWAHIDLPTQTARLRSANSKNKTVWILPLTGKLLEIIQRRTREEAAGLPFCLSSKWKADKRLSWCMGKRLQE